MFLPTSIDEARARGWKALDVVLVTGDAYIDSAYIGASVIGHVLADRGYRVGIIAQPDPGRPEDILRLGEPELFWGVTSGCTDSMVANYTALKKRRHRDDLTAGGLNTRRPDRALIAYANLIRRFARGRAPIVLGGIEASLRRIAHYDYWNDAVRRSVLFDAKADLLIYGMGERAVVEVAECLRNGVAPHDVRGLCRIAHAPKKEYCELPPFEEAARDKAAFERMFMLFAANSDPLTARGLVQKHGNRYLIQNPPAHGLTPRELDHVYELPYERDVHPRCMALGEVRALETIRFSITTHRGCCGQCNFCSIALHQGSAVVSRSEASILKEASAITRHSGFGGLIHDVGGPTANMYGITCTKTGRTGSCADRRCLHPSACRRLLPAHRRQKHVLERLRKLPGVKKVFVASGIRHDLVLADNRYGEAYLEEIVAHHVSGQMKVAPEHCSGSVLKLMGKPPAGKLLEFRNLFNRLNSTLGKKQFLTYYFLAAHPGCTMGDMTALGRFAAGELRMQPEQVQIFMPTPSTYSTLMYYTGRNPFTGEPLFVERDLTKKQLQKRALKRDDRPGAPRRTAVRKDRSRTPRSAAPAGPAYRSRVKKRKG